MKEAKRCPGTWTVSKVSELAGFITSGSRGWAKHYSDKGAQFLRIGNLNHYDIRLDLRDVQKVNPPAGAEAQRTRVVSGDILVSVTADVGMVGYVPEKFGEAYINQHIALVRPTAGVFQPYLAWFLSSDLAQQQFKRLQRGATKVGLGLTDVASVDVPLAPLQKQRSIVAKIEELLSDLDTGVTALERVRAKLKRYRASVLNAAVTGKLTETWRQQHPPTEIADKLLARILNERRKAWEVEQLSKFAEVGRTPPNGWKETYPAPTATPDQPLTVPNGWAKTTVDELSVVIRGSSPRPAGDPRYFNGNHTPWITVGCLTADENVFLTSVPTGLTAEGCEKSRFIKADTLLLTNSGATLGVPKITMIDGCINDGSVALLFLDYPIKLYLHYFLKSQTERLRRINQGAAQPNLNTGIVKAIAVPLPPIEEQKQIIAEVERRLSVMRAVEAEVEHGLKRAARLRQAILKRAFEGKLL